MPESITKPLLIQVKAVNTQYNKALTYLMTGNPQTKDEIDNLVKEADKLVATVQQTYGQLMSDNEAASNYLNSSESLSKTVVESFAKATYSGYTLDGSVSFVADEKKKVSDKKASTETETIAILFFASELNNILEIIKQIAKLLSNILSMQPIIAAILGGVTKLKATLSTELVKFEKFKRLANEKIKKNVEWSNTYIIILQDEQLANFKYSSYEQVLPNIKSPTTKERLQSKMLDALEELAVAIPARKKALEDDKKAWNTKWEKESEALQE